MPGRVIDISQDRRHLALHRGFLVVSQGGDEVGRVPLDELEAVIASGHGITHSSNLLAALAERGVPFVLCASNHSPVGMLLSVDGNYQQGKRLAAQGSAKRPLQKRLWQQLVQAKLRHQAAVLEALQLPSAPLGSLVAKVRSGDPENIEAQGARRYWPLLFGKNFRRDRGGEDQNRLLNYGYALLRSGIARGVVAAGLHPGLGIHHHNGFNALCLVDDLIEPWRPLIDLRVKALVDAGTIAVDADTKRQLADVLYTDLVLPDGRTPVLSAMQSLATSLAQVYLGERSELQLPIALDRKALRSLRRLP